MTVTEQARSAWTPTAAVRLCADCGRPMAARNKDEYTVARAGLVADKGLCVCPAQVPVRGPSLI